MNSEEEYDIWISQDDKGRIWIDPEIKPDESFALSIHVRKGDHETVVDAAHFWSEIKLKYPDAESYINQNRQHICAAADKQFAQMDKHLRK